MQSCTVAVDRTIETLGKAAGVAVVVAVGENNRRGVRGALGESLQALAGRYQRIDQNAGGLEPVRGNLAADVWVKGCPVKDPRQDLVHGLHDIARTG